MSLILLAFHSNLQASKTQPLIPLIADFSQLGIQSKNNERVILLYVSAPQCPYCLKLEQEILHPLIRSGEYQERLILAKINWASSTDIIGFQGESLSNQQFLKPFNIKVTPTLLFLNEKGQQIHEPFVGYQDNEFYWYYFDVAIDKSNHIMHDQSRKP
ncbi:MAG: thioredoxin fold domain-containing protein [Enterobacterales bacterium]|nr:thioredoxin fold domain-containing protein [Enterobacterales bacterium]